ILDKSRSSQVPLSHLKDINRESILSVDRYSAYKTLVKEKDGSLRLAWCWSHVRRDFLNLAKNQPDHEEWAMNWVEDIRNLYHLNNLRLEIAHMPQEFDKADVVLRNSVSETKQNMLHELACETLHPEHKKVLESLQRHWDGLILFVDNPEIPMDNNEAERALRGPVVGRKNFYGSCSLWSGLLASMLFSIFQTLLLWKINPQVWLQNFLRACAENGSLPLEDVSPFLPWNMSEQALTIYRAPPNPDNDTS
ncbi:MAG: transposase, partial [Desulfamplus sp.]|nr:transposase [Desulfamplus sp.]